MKNEHTPAGTPSACEIPKATSCVIPAPETKNADIAKPIADTTAKLDEKKEKCTCGGNCSNKKPV